MAPYALQPLGGWRNEACAIPIAVPGVDLTGQPLRAQIRGSADSPILLLDLPATSEPAATGIRFVNVTLDEAGVPTSHLMFQITTAGMQGLPYAGEMGDAWLGTYALQFVGVTRMTGPFAALASPIDSDAAPANRPVSWGGAAGGALVSGVTLSIGAGGVTVAVDGAGLLTDLTRIAKGLVDTATATVTAAQQALAGVAPAIQAATAAAVAQAAGSAAQAKASADSATRSAVALATARDNALASIATGLASFLTISNSYLTVSSGLAATPEGMPFGVFGSGDTYLYAFIKKNGQAVALGTLASQAALDHVGRFVPSLLDTDNSVAINAALNQPLVAGAILPPGDIRLDSGIIVPTGKFVRGAGIDVTRLVGSNAITNADYLAKTLIRTADNSTGCYIADLTVVSPIVADKVNGVWLRATAHSLAERIKALNCGYAFWHQGSSHSAMRHLESYNANVHFEATGAYDFTYEDMLSADQPDGSAVTNPLSTESIWHSLGQCQRGAFRRGRHVGIGQPIEVVNDAGGVLDDILYDDLFARNTDGKIMVFGSVIGDGSKSIGRIRVRNSRFVGDQTNYGVMAQLTGGGSWTFENNEWTSFSPDNFQVPAGNALKVINNRITVTNSEGNDGNVFAGSGGNIVVEGGVIRIVGDTQIKVAFPQDGADISPQTRVVSPNALMPPAAIGGTARWSPTADVVIPNGGGAIVMAGVDTRLELPAGQTFRITWRGRLEKTSADGSLVVGSDGNPASFFGSAAIQQPDGSFVAARALYTQTTAVNGDIREFAVDMTVVGNGSQVGFVAGSGGVTLLAGAVFTLERVA